MAQYLTVRNISGIGGMEPCINMGTKPPGNTTQSSNSQNNIIVMQHLSRCQNKRLAHMGNLNCCKNQVGEECPWSSLVLDLMLLGSCRSTLSRSLSAVSVSSLSLSWVISVKSAYCGNMALDDFAILLILSQKNSHRLLNLTTNYFWQLTSVLINTFFHSRLEFLVFPLVSDRARLKSPGPSDPDQYLTVLPGVPTSRDPVRIFPPTVVTT